MGRGQPSHTRTAVLKATKQVNIEKAKIRTQYNTKFIHSK